MSDPLSSNRVSDDNEPPKRISTHRSFSQTSSPQDVAVSLDDLKAKARERLELDQEPELNEDAEPSEDEEFCIICLQPVVDRTVLINCAHDRMCFVCIRQWTEQSRRCPLCNTPIGSHLIHRIRSQYDYQKHYLSPLQTSPPPNNIVAEARTARRVRARREASLVERERDELDRAIEKRRWVYRYGLFAKHVASNAHTRFRPNPTPQQLSNSAELQSRCQMFVRRELRVWPNLDVEFLTSFILSLVKSIDIRTEAAIKLIAEFLDIGGRTSPAGGTIAEHFVHELYSYLRSPFRELPAYDAVVQYDTPPNAEDAPPLPRASRTSDSTRDRSGQLGEPSHSRGYPAQREREPSDPLEASPRDVAVASDSDMDMAEDWVEPPPSSRSRRQKGKERMRADDSRRDERSMERGQGRSIEYRVGGRDSKDEDMGSGYRRDGRSSRPSRHNDDTYREGGRLARRGDRSSERDGEGNGSRGNEKGKGRMRGESRMDKRDDGQRGDGRSYGRDDGRYENSGHEDTQGGGRRCRGSDGREDPDVTRRDYDDDERYDDEGRLDSRQHSDDKKYYDNYTKGDSRKPAGWGNFEDGRRARPFDHSTDLDRTVTQESRASEDVNRSRLTGRSRHSPSSHSHVSPVVASESNTPEQTLLVPASLRRTTLAHSTILARPPAPLDGTPDRRPTAAGTTPNPDAPASSATRIRPPRLAPIDAIRMHLQGLPRRIGAVPTHSTEMDVGDSQNPGEARTVDHDFVWSKNQRTNDASMSATDTSTPAASFSPDGDGGLPILPQDALSAGGVAPPNVNPTTSDDRHDGTQSVSYSIRGAATRLTAQPSSFTASPIDSMQRVSPGSTHSPTPIRDRLLERLEAAKAASAISNTNLTASHPSQKASHTPSHPDSSEPPVSDFSSANAAAEERLRLIARSRASRSATNWPTDDRSHQEKPTGPAEVGDAVEAERRSRLRAKLAARKRDMNAVMGAASSADAPTR